MGISLGASVLFWLHHVVGILKERGGLGQVRDLLCRQHEDEESSESEQPLKYYICESLLCKLDVILLSGLILHNPILSPG